MAGRRQVGAPVLAYLRLAGEDGDEDLAVEALVGPLGAGPDQPVGEASSPGGGTVELGEAILAAPEEILVVVHEVLLDGAI